MVKLNKSRIDSEMCSAIQPLSEAISERALSPIPDEAAYHWQQPRWYHDDRCPSLDSLHCRKQTTVIINTVINTVINTIINTVIHIVFNTVINTVFTCNNINLSSGPRINTTYVTRPQLTAHYRFHPFEIRERQQKGSTTQITLSWLILILSPQDLPIWTHLQPPPRN